MKTNHRRNFVAKKHPNPGDMPYVTFSRAVSLPLSDRSVAARATAGDHTNGKHGIAKDRKGAKKYINSRTRFHEDAALKKIVKELE
jgi:hypothetical protein